MKTIGLLSDTHSYLDTEFNQLFESCDEVWHAGDVGDLSTWDRLKQIKPVRAVFGNIDGAELRTCMPEWQFFELEGLKVLMIHIAGSPGKYNPKTVKLIKEHQPGLLICGHSHILKVQYFAQWQHLYMNPGAAGQHGFHHMRTAMRFNVRDGQIQNAEVIELGKRGKI